MRKTLKADILKTVEAKAIVLNYYCSSAYSNVIFSETTWSKEISYGDALEWTNSNLSKYFSHMTKMAARSIYGNYTK